MTIGSVNERYVDGEGRIGVDHVQLAVDDEQAGSR